MFPHNNYATTRVVTRLAFLSYPAWATTRVHAALVSDVMMMCTPNWRDNYRCAHSYAVSFGHVGTMTVSPRHN